jgi:hypothetical protein
MGERIGKEKISRKKGFLYFIGKDGYVWEVPMKSNPSGRKSRVGSEQIKKETGYLYYLDNDGYVSKAKMARK